MQLFNSTSLLKGATYGAAISAMVISMTACATAQTAEDLNAAALETTKKDHEDKGIASETIPEPVLKAPTLAEKKAKFDAFKKSFKIAALAAGISEETYDREMKTAKINTSVTTSNNNQPEFVRMIWQYLDSAVSDSRISNGRKNAIAQDALLSEVEAKYGVDKEVIVAIWGLESAYGGFQGKHDVISSLTTLAYDGRRQKFGKEQLIAALKIIDNGYATRAQLKGSWAGAMGHTQFIPTTYLDYAVDYDGDGKRDLWGNMGDVFASTANYLSRSGYQPDQVWGSEVALPEGFDYTQARKGHYKTYLEWQELGVTFADGTELVTMEQMTTYSNQQAKQAYIIIPAGANGPAFLANKNFKSILRYNNATSYAMGVGMLSDEVAGRAKPLSNEWPRSDRSLSLTERKGLQAALNAQGFNAGVVDGIIGAGTKQALRDWQSSNGHVADGYPSVATYKAVTGQ